MLTSLIKLYFLCANMSKPIIVGGFHVRIVAALLTGKLRMFLVLRQQYQRQTSFFCLVFNNRR